MIVVFFTGVHLMIVQPGISAVISWIGWGLLVLLLIAFLLVYCPELPSSSCACLSSSRRCRHLQQMAPVKWPGRKATSPSH